MIAPPLPYDRAPSRDLVTLLRPGGLLEPILDLPSRNLRGIALDVHFRRNDEIHVYWGRTRVLIAELMSDETVKISANQRYARQPCARDLLLTWHAGEPGFGRVLEAYLRDLVVHPKFVHGEGAIQAQWSRVQKPWVPFDREAVLGYESTSHREESRSFPEVDSARDKLQAIYEEIQQESGYHERWESPPIGASRDKIDQLAVDPEGQLVLIELKDAASNDSALVYYAPFQLLRYVWTWHSVLDHVRGGLQQLIDVRVAVGLTPVAPWLTRGVRPVIGFGRDTRSDEVKRRYSAVLSVVNAHLPPGVAGVETWEYTDAGPSRVACDQDQEGCSADTYPDGSGA